MRNRKTSKTTSAVAAVLAAALAAGAIGACGSSKSTNTTTSSSPPATSTPASNSGSGNSGSSANSGSTGSTGSGNSGNSGNTGNSGNGGTGNSGNSGTSGNTATVTQTVPNGITAAGTKLKLGATARVQYSTVTNSGNDGPTYYFAVTVTGIKKGSMADFKGASLTGVPKGSTPYYVDMAFTNVGSKPLSTSSGEDPAASMGDIVGDNIDSPLTILIGDFPKCPQPTTPKAYEPHVQFDTCEIFMEKTPVTEVAYNGSDATIDDPIIWQP